MPVYTVHQPPVRANEAASDPHGFVFIRDGFHFWAFLLSPLWLLWYRLWLAFIGYIVLALLIGGLATAVNASQNASAILSLLLALLIGFEAPSLRRWTLRRRGWQTAGIVVADSVEGAERRFFDAWTGRVPPPTSPPPAPPEPAASDTPVAETAAASTP